MRGVEPVCKVWFLRSDSLEKEDSNLSSLTPAPCACQAAKRGCDDAQKSASPAVFCGGALPAADLPIREVTLYKHGVASFERSGELKPGETVRIDFKPEDMNDVLKSLAITDHNGGKVNGVRYDSSEPLEKRLEDFPFKVSGGTGLAAFLDQIKGARIQLKLGAGVVTGTILSGRVVRESDKDRIVEREVAVLLLDSGELRTFDLAAASSVKFEDPKLESQLKDYLIVLNQSRSRDRRSVYMTRRAPARANC